MPFSPRNGLFEADGQELREIAVRAIEAGLVIELLREAIGEEAVPEILTSIRQKTERESEITSLFRGGQASEALDRVHDARVSGRQAVLANLGQPDQFAFLVDMLTARSSKSAQ